jgi:Spy/CpxP family protein refolding chaperone
MTRNPIAAVIAFVLLAASASSVRAQAEPRQQVAPQRAELERRLRERTAEVVRRRLQLNDDQMARLATVNQQLDQQRMALVGEERQARIALRAELQAGNAANQQKVGTLLDQMLRLQRRRLDLIENEQRELAKFLTPVQRAKYFGLQNEIRKRMQELRDRPPAARRRMLGPGAGRIIR